MAHEAKLQNDRVMLIMAQTQLEPVEDNRAHRDRLHYDRAEQFEQLLSPTTQATEVTRGSFRIQTDRAKSTGT